MSVPIQNAKIVQVVAPGVIKDDASFTVVNVDTLGFQYLTVVCHLGATDIAMTALKLQESTATGGSYTDVTGAIFGTSTEQGSGSASTLPSATDDDTFAVFELDCRTRKRWIKLVATAGNGAAGTYMSALGILSRGGEVPNTTAERGCSQILRVT